MKRIIHTIMKNAVIRFWVTHMAIFFLALFLCIVGFHRFFLILEETILEENRQLMSQSISEAEDMLDDMYRFGMQLSLSDTIPEASRITKARDAAYYQAMQVLLSESVDIGKYYDSRLTESNFIYLKKYHRVLYNGTLYPMEVFEVQLENWGISEEEYRQLFDSQETSPAFFCTERGHLFYLFPCLSETPSDSLGLVIFYISDDLLLQHMTFLQGFSSYSLFIYQSGSLIFSADGLECAGKLSPEWKTVPGAYSMQEKLVLTLSPAAADRTYLLVLPQQEALTQLPRLRLFVCLLVGGAILLEALFAFFLSFRNGRSVNEMAQTLQTQDADGYSTDLRQLNASVARVVEENRQAEPAFQKSFFHNLLKASFVSSAEMNYMAKRANLSLNGGSYCAAALRLFPRCPLDSIDEATAVRAGLLQDRLEGKLRELYPGRFWSYRHNVAVGLYILENASDDWDPLLQALTAALQWLGDVHQADACWGIGTPCSDLMYFWKSAEEAYAMLELEGAASRVRLYVDAPSAADSYYLPYTIEDRLVQGIRSGDRGEVKSALEIIYTENFVHRSPDSRQFQKLNARIIDILTEQINRMEQREPILSSLHTLREECNLEDEEYFKRLYGICDQISRQLNAEKSSQRSDKINAILRFIQDHYSNPEMGLTMLGEQFGLSEAYLSTLFKAEVNVNFAEYLEQTRIQAACEYLKEGMLIAEVAEKTGYNSVHSFRRAFKRVMQVSPSDYRK